MGEQKISTVYRCPYCKVPIMVIGDPATEEELLRLYLTKKPICMSCNNVLLKSNE
jgi:predicted RNA-binding Zn-ribbon protein involved in translation (DUF1610 family)